MADTHRRRNTLNIAWLFNRVPTEQEPYVQEHVPAWRSAIIDDATGRWIDTHIMNQDYIAWAGQGRIADRTKEHLGRSDGGVVMLRKRLRTELDAVAQGRDPKGVIRDPAAAHDIALPIADRDLFVRGASLAELSRHPVHGQHLETFMFQAGQPPDVWNAFRRAMGLPETDVAERMASL